MPAVNDNGGAALDSASLGHPAQEEEGHATAAAMQQPDFDRNINQLLSEMGQGPISTHFGSDGEVGLSLLCLAGFTPVRFCAEALVGCNGRHACTASRGRCCRR